MNVIYICILWWWGQCTTTIRLTGARFFFFFLLVLFFFFCFAIDNAIEIVDERIFSRKNLAYCIWIHDQKRLFLLRNIFFGRDFVWKICDELLFYSELFKMQENSGNWRNFASSHDQNGGKKIVYGKFEAVWWTVSGIFRSILLKKCHFTEKKTTFIEVRWHNLNLAY